MNLRIAYLLFIVSFFLLFACKKREKHPGFKETPTGLFYKLCYIGEGQKPPAPGDYLEMHIVYKTWEDSVFMDTKRQNVTGTVILPLGSPSFKGSFEENFSSLNEGDSVTYLVNTDSLFMSFLKTEKPYFMQGQDMAKIEIKVKGILNKMQYAERITELEHLTENQDMEEQKQLSIYLKKNNINNSPFETGLYYLPILEGNGARVENDKTIIFHYEGSFLDGTVFDATQNDLPFEFLAGKQDQLIKGLEQGIMLLKEGSKAKFIIPSQLAYGADGSSTGIVPPYTTLIYKVEILKVK